MGYVLLWLESLAVALLLVATLTACIGRLRRRPMQLILWVLAALVPLAIYAGLAVVTGYLSFKLLAPAKWFYAVLAVAIVYLAGAVWIRLGGLRRVDHEPSATVAGSWPRAKLAIALAVVLALHMMTFWNLDLAARQRLATLRTEAGALALSVAPARIPDRDNAALVYARAFEAMGPAEDWNEKWGKWPEPGATDFDPRNAELRQFLHRHASSLVLLHEAARKPDCYFDRDYGRPSIDVLLPEFAQLRRAARLLAADANCQAADGNIGAALEDVNCLFTVAEHSASHPMLLTMLVAVAIDSMAVETLQDVLASGQASAMQLKLAAVDIDESVSYRRLLERAFRMEEAFGTSIVCQMSNAPYRVFLLGDDLAAYRSFMKKCRRLTAQPYYRAKNDWKELDQRLDRESRGLLTRCLTPAVVRCTEVAIMADARRRLARLALAMHRYRAAENRFPDKLEELVPDYIIAVPRDPFDGKPMKLTRTGKGLILYSIGPDVTDDEGKRFDKDKRTGDITFELFTASAED